MRTVLFLLVFFLLSMTHVFAEASPTAEPECYTIAVIPYVGATAELKTYVKDIVKDQYMDGFLAPKIKTIPEADVEKALKDEGYDLSVTELPGKDVFAAVAKDTNADYVIGMKIAKLSCEGYIQFISTEIKTKAQLQYKFYNRSTDRFIVFQTNGSAIDAAAKTSITNAINEAMQDGYQKITDSL
jgi:hypothetical protein